MKRRWRVEDGGWNFGGGDSATGGLATLQKFEDDDDDENENDCPRARFRGRGRLRFPFAVVALRLVKKVCLRFRNEESGKAGTEQEYLYIKF